MIQVWKCDHCSHFTQDAAEMRAHEDKCEWNIKNKTCQTCEHSSGDIEGNTTCALNVKIKGRFGNVNCSKWFEMFDYS